MSEKLHSVRITDTAYKMLVRLALHERRTIAAEMDVIIEDYADNILDDDD